MKIAFKRDSITFIKWSIQAANMRGSMQKEYIVEIYEFVVAIIYVTYIVPKQRLKSALSDFF